MAQWTIHISLIIPHGQENRVLILPDEDNWVLPKILAHHTYSNLHLIQRNIRERFDADMTILHWMRRKEDEENHTVESAALMENHTVDWIPPAGARWIDVSELEGVSFAEEGTQETLRKVFALLSEPAPSERAPWFYKGWFNEAKGWMTDQLEKHGYVITVPPEQFKQFSISALLRAETTSGDVYFKVANNFPLFGNEPKLMQALAALFPDQIPAPIAIDEQRRWMLADDFGQAVRMAGDPSYELMARIMREYAALQIHTASMLDQLFEVGCLDRRAHVLARQIDLLMADEASYASLSEEERTAWKNAEPRLKALCEQLSDYGIPNTLVHGDFHGGNIALQNDRLLFFDWTDACVGHPFFDPLVILDFDSQDHAEALRDVYLECWTDYAPMERLQEAYRIAEILGALHQAVSYQGIRAGVEEQYRADWEWGVPHFARLILGKLQAL